MAKVDKSIILTDTIIDELMEDWFERDGETFTKIRKTGRLGWEKSLEEGDSYSSYLLEAPTEEDLIKRAYTLARETIVVMDPPFKVHVKITKGSGDSYTNGKVVCVNTAMFDDSELSTGAKLDIFLGTTVHEGCHLLYTDLSMLGKIKIPVVQQIWNIIEDERIEQICGEQKPGLANFLEQSKYYYFDHYYLDYVATKEKESKLSPFDRIMNCFLHIIRYPKYLKEEEIIEFGHYLLEIKKVILPYPTTTEQAVKAAYKVFDIIKDYYEDIEREETEGDSSESEDGEGDGKSEKLSDGEISEKAMKKLLADAKDAEEVFKKIISSPTLDSKGLSDGDLSSEVKKDRGILGEVCEGSVELGGSENSFFIKEENEQRIYLDSLYRVKQYIPAISRIMKGHCKEYKLTHRSMRSGVLDVNKLAEAYQGVPTCYVREGQVKTDKVSVCVLIDESGSMGGKRIQAARDAAVLINEALKQVPNVELFIYGHSGDIKRDTSTELFVYREKGYAPKFSLGSVKARSQNRDGVAILEVAKRVRKQTKNPVLYFILSDGEPCAGGYYGTSAMEHVRNCVSQTEKLGMQVIQVCINHSYDPGKMFKNFVVMENMSTLAKELGKAIKKSTMTMAKTNIL